MSDYPIIDSVDEKFLGGMKSVSDRYYEHKYNKIITDKGEFDHRICFHSNRVCLVSLGENHPVLKNKKKISKVDYLASCLVDRLQNNAGGKRKRGALKLSPNFIICHIECEDGTVYPVYSCVKGKLLEINKNLIENPNLLIDKPVSEGYIALVLPQFKLHERYKKSMMSTEDYFST